LRSKLTPYLNLTVFAVLRLLTSFITSGIGSMRGMKKMKPTVKNRLVSTKIKPKAVRRKAIDKTTSITSAI